MGSMTILMQACLKAVHADCVRIVHTCCQGKTANKAVHAEVSGNLRCALQVLPALPAEGVNAETLNTDLHLQSQQAQHAQPLQQHETAQHEQQAQRDQQAQQAQQPAKETFQAVQEGQAHQGQHAKHARKSKQPKWKVKQAKQQMQQAQHQSMPAKQAEADTPQSPLQHTPQHLQLQTTAQACPTHALIMLQCGHQFLTLCCLPAALQTATTSCFRGFATNVMKC